MRDIPEVLYIYCKVCDYQTKELFEQDWCPVCEEAGQYRHLQEYTTEDAAIEDAERNMDEARLGEY